MGSADGRGDGLSDPGVDSVGTTGSVDASTGTVGGGSDSSANAAGPRSVETTAAATATMDSGSFISDESGIELPSIQAARVEAVRSLADIAPDDRREVVVEVGDDEGCPPLQDRSLL